MTMYVTYAKKSILKHSFKNRHCRTQGEFLQIIFGDERLLMTNYAVEITFKLSKSQQRLETNAWNAAFLHLFFIEKGNDSLMSAEKWRSSKEFVFNKSRLL